MRLKSVQHNQQQHEQPGRRQQHQEQQYQWHIQQSTNQRLKTHVTIVIVSVIPMVVAIGFCLLATTAVAAVIAAPTVTSSHHADAIQIGDTKQRIPRQVAVTDKQEDKAVDDDCDTLYGRSASASGASSSSSSAYHKPHFAKGRSVIVELFEWKFEDVADECRTFLGPMGYAGVQLSPVLEHTVIKTDKLKHPWWQRFETMSYRFATRSGDESDFWSMTRICNDNGVRVYLDVLLNHMAAPPHLLHNETKGKVDFTVNTLLESNVNISNFTYPNVPYSSKHFHRPCAVGDSPVTHDIRNCQLNGHPDLDLGQPAVAKHIVQMLNKFIDMGVAGFHVYAAKYVWPNDLKKIHEQLKDLHQNFHFPPKSRPFMSYDVCDMGLDTISKTEYAAYGSVTEYLYATELSTILSGKVPLSSLINWGPAMGFLAHQDALIFIDSPETQRGLPREMGNNRVITHRNPQKYAMANALMMTHPYGGIKRIMSSYYFKASNKDQGPPVEEDNEDVIRSQKMDEKQQCVMDSGWVCEHRWPIMVSLVELANYFSVPENGENSVLHFQTDGPNHIAFCRGSKAFVAMNNDEEQDFIREVFTCLEPGVYCDIISGGLKEDAKDCSGHRLEVNATGHAKLQLLVADANDGGEVSEDRDDRSVVENMGVLVIYEGSKIGNKVGKVWLKAEENKMVADGETSGNEVAATDQGKDEDYEEETPDDYNKNVGAEGIEFYKEQESKEKTAEKEQDKDETEILNDLEVLDEDADAPDKPEDTVNVKTDDPELIVAQNGDQMGDVDEPKDEEQEEEKEDEGESDKDEVLENETAENKEETDGAAENDETPDEIEKTEENSDNEQAKEEDEAEGSSEKTSQPNSAEEQPEAPDMTPILIGESSSDGKDDDGWVTIEEEGKDETAEEKAEEGKDETPGEQKEEGKDETPEEEAEEDKDETPEEEAEEGKDETPGEEVEEGKDETAEEKAEEGKDGTPGAEKEEGKDETPGEEAEEGKDETPEEEAEEGKDETPGEEVEEGKDKTPEEEAEEGKDKNPEEEAEEGKDETAGGEAEEGKDKTPGEEESEAEQNKEQDSSVGTPTDEDSNIEESKDNNNSPENEGMGSGNAEEAGKVEETLKSIETNTDNPQDIEVTGTPEEVLQGTTEEGTPEEETSKEASAGEAESDDAGNSDNPNKEEEQSVENEVPSEDTDVTEVEEKASQEDLDPDKSHDQGHVEPTNESPPFESPNLSVSKENEDGSAHGNEEKTTSAEVKANENDKATNVIRNQIESPVVVNVEQSVQVNGNSKRHDMEEKVHELERHAEAVYEATEQQPMQGAMFPAVQPHADNGNQMLKSHTFLIWLIIARMLVLNIDLEMKIPIHIMLKPSTP